MSETKLSAKELVDRLPLEIVRRSLFGKELKEYIEKEENPFEAKAKSVRQSFVYHTNRITFRQSKELARFIATDENEQKQLSNIAKGELHHLVMSGINRKEDLTKVLDKLTIEGLIASEEQYNNIKVQIESALSNPEAADWFTDKYKLYNECSILVNKKDEAMRRPDRVMINGNEAIVVDYKFAKKNDSYKKQVKLYMDLLGQMGYEKVKGYLWYIYENKNIIEEVKDI